MEVDINSPDLFNKGVDVAKQQLNTINRLSTNILLSIINAYDSAHNLAQTEAQYAELCNLLQSFCDFLQQTGVGASSALASQQHTWDEAAAATAAHSSYTQRIRIQENAAVVANLLGSHASAS